MGRNGRPEGVVGMTNKQLNGYLEILAKYLDALGYHEAADVVRQAKV